VIAAREVVDIVRDNRMNGHYLEQWAADLLRRIRRDVQVVGGIHGGAVPDHFHQSGTWDILADGIFYEVKGCTFRIRRSSVRSKTQYGRWKIDADAHHAIPADVAARTMYLLIVRVGKRPVVAYLVSHARMTSILERYWRQGRFVSLSHIVVGRELLTIFDARRKASKPRRGGA
jgi:hypothetical protein